MKMISGQKHLDKTAKLAGVSKGVLSLSTGAYTAGQAATVAVLADLGLDAAFGPDLAASSIEAAAEFVSSHSVSVGGVDMPMAILPSGDEFPKVQELNKHIMAYIIRFQKSSFEG